MNLRKHLWLFAFMFYVVMDLSTTFVGMNYDSITEANPFFLFAYNNDGYITLASAKIGVFALLYYLDTIMKFIEREFLKGIQFPIIPLLVMLGGMDVTINNLNLIIGAGASFEEIIITTLAVVLPVMLGKKIYDIEFNDNITS